MVIVISTQKPKAGHRETEIAKGKGTGTEITTVTVMWSNIKRAPADFESMAQDPFNLLRLSDPSTPSRWQVFVRIDKKAIKSTFFERLLRFSPHRLLRAVKFKARIPIQLVGVVDKGRAQRTMCVKPGTDYGALAFRRATCSRLRSRLRARFRE